MWDIEIHLRPSENYDFHDAEYKVSLSSTKFLWRAPVLIYQNRIQNVEIRAYWCPLVRKRQIHEKLGVPIFADHIRVLTAIFDSKLAVVGNPLLQ